MGQPSQLHRLAYEGDVHGLSLFLFSLSLAPPFDVRAKPVRPKRRPWERFLSGFKRLSYRLICF